MTTWDKAPAPATNWQPNTEAAGLAGGIRERQADFWTPTHQTDGVSLDRRPDAVAFDGHIAFAYGPIANGDSTFGALARAWSARDTGAAVMLARENDPGNDWLPEIELFSYNGAPIDELDLAFEQAARPVVCAERAGHLWLYWYNPFAAAFEFSDFGIGRTPRIILDNPPDLTNSDVIVFYFNDAAGFLCYRMQRERYLTEHTTPVFASPDRFLEEVAVAVDARLHCYYSERNALTGRYGIGVLESTLYPIYLPNEDRAQPDAVPLLGEIVTTLINSIATPDGVTVEAFPLTGTLDAPQILHSQPNDDRVTPNIVPLLGTLAASLIGLSQPNDDRISPNAIPRFGTLAVILIAVTIYDPDTIAPNAIPVLGTLEVV